MRFSLVSALVVVLALAHGTESVSLAKRDVSSEVDRVTKFIKDMFVTITSETQDIVEKVKAHELTNKAQTYIEDSRAQIQPMVDKMQADIEELQRQLTAELQKQLTPFIGNIEEQIKPLTSSFHAQIEPLTSNFHAQVKPLAEQVERLFQQVVDQTKALLPPQ